MIDHSSGEIGFSEETELNWRNNLRTFREKVWPVMQEEGMTNFDTAYLAWHLAVVNQSINSLQELFEDKYFG